MFNQVSRPWILQMSVSERSFDCSMITPLLICYSTSPFLQIHIYAYICILRSCLWGNRMFWVWNLCSHALWGTRKEIHMEICEVPFNHTSIGFYHLRVKFVTLQEQHANSTWALMSDSNKICGQSWVIQNERQVWGLLHRTYGFVSIK